MMNSNPLLDELHATRQKLLAESGGTLAGLVARLQAEQKTSGRIILSTRQTQPCADSAKPEASADADLTPPRRDL